MKLLNALEVPFEKPRTSHREPGILFRRLFQGESRARDNFELTIARTEGRYQTPRHRHNFDQIRVGLSGEFGGKKQTLGAGEIGYYPEGVYYDIDCEDSEVLTLQFAGANGDGYPSYNDLYEASATMSKVGTFKDGVFFRNERVNLAPGEKKNMDGYEALWQHIFGRPVVYPKPRYREPIIMDTRNYKWLGDPRQHGLRRKLIGMFTERAIAIEQIEVAAGAALHESAPLATKFLFVHSGAGLSAQGAWNTWSVARIERGEQASVTAETPMTFTAISLPAYLDEEIRAA